MQKPLVKNAADSKDVKQAKAREKVRDQEGAADMRLIMAQPYGRRFVWSLLEFAGVFRTSFTGNSATFYNEGMRNVGLMVMAKINETCPEKYLLMLQEQREKDRLHDLPDVPPHPVDGEDEPEE